MSIKVKDAECHDDSPSSLIELPGPIHMDSAVERADALALYVKLGIRHKIASFPQLDFGPVRQDEGMDVAVGGVGWSNFAPFPSMGA